MNYEAIKRDDLLLIKINLATANIRLATEFRDYLLSIIENDKEKKIIIDFQNVKFVDSAFLTSLVTGLKKITSYDGDIKLLNLNKPVRALFELTRLYKIFEIFQSEDDAIASFA